MLLEGAFPTATEFESKQRSQNFLTTLICILAFVVMDYLFMLNLLAPGDSALRVYAAMALITVIGLECYVVATR
jgi:hypothetical protein